MADADGLHIAVVYDCFFPATTGGGERQYRAFAERFVERGHRVSYLTRRQWDDTPPPVPAGLEVVEVAGRARLYDEHGGRRLPPALGFALAVSRHLLRRRRRYDAVLVSALPALNVPAVRLALLGRRMPICADFLEVWRPEQWRQYSGAVVGRIATLLQRLAVRLSPLASCHSRMNGRRLEAEGLRTPPVISPGLIHGDTHAEARPVPDEPPTVVYAGRMIPDKRVESIPAALAEAGARVPALRARLFGDGESRAAVVAEVARLGLDDVVEVPGFVAQDELERAMAGAACLVNPSRREGYGLVVVEACATGTPVVLAEAPDNASLELVEPGVNGAVARSTEPADLGAAIAEVVLAGEALRRSTRAWFEEAARTRTMTAAADGVLAALTNARGAAPLP
ncbi:glycosyltransferase family 4 protein [Geodermatophilus sp. SYSU D00696]